MAFVKIVYAFIILYKYINYFKLLYDQKKFKFWD